MDPGYLRVYQSYMVGTMIVHTVIVPYIILKITKVGPVTSARLQTFSTVSEKFCGL